MHYPSAFIHYWVWFLSVYSHTVCVYAFEQSNELYPILLAILEIGNPLQRE